MTLDRMVDGTRNGEPGGAVLITVKFSVDTLT
jgi:hypothetical protein